MRRRTIAVLVVAAVTLSLFLFSPAPSSAADANRWYVAGNFIATFVEDSDLQQQGATLEASFDTGFGVSAAVGHKMGAFRFEGELGYRVSDIDTFSAGGVEVSADEGDVSATSLMLNAYYDIPTGTAFSPYIGAGLGAAQVSINDARVLGIAVADDDDTVFAWQLAAGVNIGIGANLALDLGYRYFATSDPSFNDAGGTSFDAEYTSHNVQVGVRFLF